MDAFCRFMTLMFFLGTKRANQARLRIFQLRNGLSQTMPTAFVILSNY